MKSRFMSAVVMLAIYLIPFNLFSQSFIRGSKNTEFNLEGMYTTFSPSIGRDTLVNPNFAGTFGIGRNFHELFSVFIKYGFGEYSTINSERKFNSSMTRHFVQIPLLFSVNVLDLCGRKNRYGACHGLELGISMGGDLMYSFLKSTEMYQSKLESGIQAGLKFSPYTVGSQKRLQQWDIAFSLIYRHGISPGMTNGTTKLFSDYIAASITLSRYKIYKWGNM